MVREKNNKKYSAIKLDMTQLPTVLFSFFKVAMTCAKFGLLLVLNISLIAIVVKQRRQARTFLTSCPQTSFSRRLSKEKTGRNLLIGCLVVYFVTHLPAVSAAYI